MLPVCWCSLAVVCLFGGFWVTVVGVAIQFCWVWDFGGVVWFWMFWVFRVFRVPVGVWAGGFLVPLL